MKRFMDSSFAPWSGLAAGMLGEGLHHQLLSDALRFDCTRGGALPGLALGIAVLMLMGAGAWVSWASAWHPRTRHPGTGPRVEDPRDGARHFLACMSLMGASLFAIAVVWQTVAGFIVPACPT
jgi:hypothetical protein